MTTHITNRIAADMNRYCESHFPGFKFTICISHADATPKLTVKLREVPCPIYKSPNYPKMTDTKSYAAPYTLVTGHFPVGMMRRRIMKFSVYGANTAPASKFSLTKFFLSLKVSIDLQIPTATMTQIPCVIISMKHFVIPVVSRTTDIIWYLFPAMFLPLFRVSELPDAPRQTVPKRPAGANTQSTAKVVSVEAAKNTLLTGQ